MSEISFEEIEKFLEGRNNDKYIVAVEGNYYSNHVDVIYNHPTKGKYIKQEKYTSFIYFNDEIIPILYGGNKAKINQERINNKIKIKKLRTTNEKGETPKRIENGYKYIAQCSLGYGTLLNFFKQGGVDVYSKEYRHCFVTARPEEQFLIQTGKRLFKGIDDYNELHRFQFDLETTGIDPSTNSIFQIGVKDNKGFEFIIDIDGEDDIEKRKNEVTAIKDFFRVIDTIQPDLITGYNSENFDWDFFFKRCERLNINIKDIATTLNPRSKIRRKENTLKLGSKNEKYMQTYMWGYNVLDISHAVRQAKSINSDIKKWSLKYITVFAEAEKENRVYIKGDKLYKIWSDKVNEYAFNDDNGKWYIINEERPLKEGFKIVNGKYVVERYLKDDLWETNKVDEIFNQAVFLLAKLLPTSFQRTYTMGTAGKWGLIMLAWSYEQGIAIPCLEEKEDFTGGLARLVEVGFAKDVAKLDFAALYPNIEITWDIIPDLDISGVMKGLLLYIAETRDKYKLLKLEHEEKGDFKTANVFDKKQLPLKILANSFFGAFGASYLYHWGDLKCAEETTCRGRQYLRLMVRHFYEKYGFRPLVGDSVTGDTPIFIKWKKGGYIDIMNISEMFDGQSSFSEDEKLRDFSTKPYYVLTVNGWKEINYVYRHRTNKKIHRVTTKDRMVYVTEDHSLFQNGKMIPPSKLNVGDKIDITNVEKFNAFEHGLTFKYKDKIPFEVLNASYERKIEFLDWFFKTSESAYLLAFPPLLLAGIKYLIDCTNYKTDLDFGGESNIISRNEVIKTDDEYVYDISTEDGTFIGGVGGVNLKNTDGFNFAIPESVNNISYHVKGSHRLTERYKDQTLTGLDAVVAEFNEEYMIGRMGLDVDDVCESTINFKRKNYANLIIKKGKNGKIKQKIKIVGATIKADNLPTYQEEFINESMELLLNNRGYEFINLYNRTVEDIYNYRIPLVNLASKSKVNDTVETYKKKMLTTNKAGNPQAKQAHMELVLRDNLNVNLGDVIYYVNTGTAKSHPDIKTITDKETGDRHVEFNCVRIPNRIYEDNVDILNDIKELEEKLIEINDELSEEYVEIENKIDELKSKLYVEKYNVAKYVDSFNKRMNNLLVCFSPEIRGKIFRKVVKNKETKEMELEDKTIFNENQCELVAGHPLESKDQDDYNEKLMKMEDKEIKFWTTYDMTPNNIDLKEWEDIKKDYFIRKEKEKKEDIEKQTERVEKVINDLSDDNINELLNEAKLPLTLKTFAKLDTTEVDGETIVGIISKKHDVLLMNLDDVIKMQI